MKLRMEYNMHIIKDTFKTLDLPYSVLFKTELRPSQIYVTTILNIFVFVVTTIMLEFLNDYFTKIGMF